MTRTRVAPSPTGFPHIGTIYQALFDYSYAKKNEGKFIVRIEDTDRSRLVEGAEEKIYEALDWFGLTEDESPRKGGTYGSYRQSERLPLYQKYAKELVEKNKGYYCFCSKERLEEVRKKLQQEKKVPMYDQCCRHLSQEEIDKNLKEKKPWVIRLKIPKNERIEVIDGIRGKITFDSNNIDDQVLLKSDGFPTYHLAVVVDDHLMKITEAVRGEEWLSSLPKHALIYKFLGWKMPLYFHTPILRNPDRSKLSKRQGHTNVDWYQKEGYLPEAILNYLALIGWSHPEGEEFFSLDEFIQLFELKDLKPVGPIFDINKLEWMSGEYIRKLKVKDLKLKIVNFIDKNYSEEIVERTIPLIQERIKKLSDYLPLCGFFFKRPEKYEIDLSARKDLFKNIYDSLNQIKGEDCDVTGWSAISIGENLQNLAKKLGVKNSEFFMLLRVAITGKKISPPLNGSMELLGKKECLERLSKVKS